MTSEERKEYMREYRKQHKDQIKRTAQKRNEKIALLALDHAFRIMDLEIVYADSLLNNTRSQHVLKKVGFKEIRRDESFVYYECRKQDRIDPAV